MRLVQKLLLSAGFVALSSSPSGAYQPQQLRGLPVVVDNNGDGGCRVGEEYMHITSKCDLAGFDRYTMTWRQLTDSCRRPVFNGFEATGLFHASDKEDEDKSHLSMYACAPYGYYELEVRVDGPDTLQGIQCQIEAGSNEGLYFMFDEWNKNAENHWVGVNDIQHTLPSAGTYTWPFRHDGSQLENIWSGPEPKACGMTAQTSGTRIDRSLQAVVPQTSVGTATLQGCYDYAANTGAAGSLVLKYMAVGVFGVVDNQFCFDLCSTDVLGSHWLFATGNGNSCYCGDGDLNGGGTLATCTTGCEKSPQFACGGADPATPPLSVYRIEVSPNTPQPPEIILGDDGAAVRQGCYLLDALNTGGPAAILTAPVPAVTGLMTNKKCLDACSDGGNWIFGTANGDECWCGDAFLPATSASLSKCSTVCDGSAEACGGIGHVNVYTIPLPPNTPQPPQVVTVAGGDTDLLGCYPAADNVGKLTLLATRAVTMTNYLCSTLCSDGTNWLFATRNGGECWCGEGPLTKKARLGKCNVKCGGGPILEACGGATHLSVYGILALPGTPQPPAVVSGGTDGDSELQGCYVLGSNSAILTEIVNSAAGSQTMSNQLCRDICSDGTNWLFGTADGDECWCGEGPLTDKTILAKCSTKCTGHRTDACGGVNTARTVKYVSVYNIPVPPDAAQPPANVQGLNGVTSTLLGCYPVVANAVSTTSTLATPILRRTLMTNELCLLSCPGSARFGTSNGVDCFCGNNGALTGKVGIEKCNTKCGGDPTVSPGKAPAACGGTIYVSVYDISEPSSAPNIPPFIQGPEGLSGLLGCYPYALNEATKVGGSVVGLDMVEDVMTNQVCLGICLRRGYTLSGTYNGQGCYCRASLPNGSSDDTQCDTGCDAKPDEACGGETSILFYGTALPGTAPSLQPFVEDSSKLLGCYSLYENRPILTEGPIMRPNKMTNEECLRICKIRNTWMFGTHKGTDCYCGEGPPRGNLWDGECDITCEDSPSSCGGEYAIVLYDIPLPDSAPDLQLTIGGTSRLLGCFPFTDNLDYLTHGPLLKWGLMTNEVCLDYCRERNTWMFGTINAKYCFCGEGPPLGDDKRERCNTACEDPSSNDACGGESYLALYGIPVPGTVPEPVSNLQLVVDGADLLGCYPFSDNYVLLTDGPFTKWGKMTNEVCLSICRERGTWLFGTADSKYCYCGEGVPQGRRDDSKCDTPCEDSRYLCGGENHLTFYKIPVPVVMPPPPSPDDVEGADSIGCFDVSSNRLNFEEDVYHSPKMTNKKCGRHCKYRDLWVFATTHGTDCFCGEKLPIGPSPSNKCDTECGGDRDMSCGSDTRMDVFKWREDTPSPPVTPPTTTLWADEVDGAYSKGCFEDDPASPVLDEYYFYSRTLTAEECGVECWKMDYDVFATKNGLACFCGNTVPNANWRVDTCHTPCKGDNTVACGGTNSINVYQWATYSSEDPYEESPDIYPISSDSSEEEPRLSVGTVQGARSRGCFRDSASDRVLAGHQLKSDNMSAQECGRVCKSKKFKVFGVEFGRECFCGDRVPSGDGKADKCDKPCTGERWEVCGGHSRINIYEFWGGADVSSSSSSDDEEPTSLKDDAVEGALALGCYKDDKNNRVLDKHKFDDKASMTAQRCGHECYKRGYKVFGTEFGRECFCGHDTPDPDWQADRCDSECTGNKWVACGGRNRINIFKWINGYGDSESDSSPDDNDYGGMLHQDMYEGATHLGCYEDSTGKRALDKDELDKGHMTTRVCGDYCKGKGYAFFGTEYSTECFCGNYFRGKKTSDSDCDRPCAGKTSTVCGGHSRISVYQCDEHSYESSSEDDEIVEPEPENMLGCYKDTSSKRVLNLQTNYKLDDMTPEKCYWHCRATVGAMYYGVEFGKECYCGNHNSTYDDHPLEETSCRMPCPGDNKRYCGGRDAISVYGRQKK